MNDALVTVLIIGLALVVLVLFVALSQPQGRHATRRAAPWSAVSRHDRLLPPWRRKGMP